MEKKLSWKSVIGNLDIIVASIALIVLIVLMVMVSIHISIKIVSKKSF